MNRAMKYGKCRYSKGQMHLKYHDEPKNLSSSIFMQVPLYAAAQLTGAIGAAFTLRELLYPIKHLGTTTPSGTEIQALVMEIVVTFSMMFITSAVATDTKAVNTRLFKIFPPFPFSLTYICFSILAFIDRRASRHSSWFSSMHNFHLGRVSTSAHSKHFDSILLKPQN